jgi:cupin fold WbuC family metalloprotein
VGIRVFSAEYLDHLAEEGDSSPRRRQHRNVHSDFAEPVQRLFNAIGLDSYIRPHRHAASSGPETMIAVRGRFALVVFDDGGEVLQTAPFGTADPWARLAVGGEIPAGSWHTVLALDAGAILLEIKAGPFDPAKAKEFASWAPDEGSAEASLFLRHLRSRCF